MQTKKEVDEQILSAVVSGKKQFYQIHQTTGLEYRVVDRRLQQLRKRGLISYDRQNGWTSSPPKTK